MPTSHLHLLCDTSNSVVENNVNEPGNWGLIVNWPGLDKIYLLKITQTLSARTLVQQFPTNVLICPPSVDRVIYALKNQSLGHDANDFLKKICII